MSATGEATLIKAIDKAAVHRICSGQVVLDLATAVKELLENSLDAGATSIEIKLKDYGAESFEVADNGYGVSPDNYQALTLKYHTSKISEFADLQYLSSFGFRGEALSSLCALGHLTVVTRTKNEPVATQLKFDHSGLIISQKSEARPIGTTVTVSKLFTPLPVRHKEFNRNIRREYSRLLSILNAYALITKGVRLVCTHLSGKTRTVILKTQGTNSMKDNIITVFGTKTASYLEHLDLCVAKECYIEGFISKPGAGSGRASGDRQFFYINGRPVELPKVAKLLNELYRSFNSQQYPMAFLNFILPTTAYDVNVTPDKRKVFLHEENSLIAALKESLENIYAPDRYTYSVQNLQSTCLEKKSFMARELPEFETQKCSEEVFIDLDEDSPDRDHDDSSVEPGVDAINVSAGGPLVKEKTCKASVSGANLDSFQCNASLTSGSFSKTFTSQECELKAGIGLGKKCVSNLHHKVIQSKLTGFATNVKRQAEDGALISEEPLLKKWSLSAADESRKEPSDGHMLNGLKRCNSEQVVVSNIKGADMPREINDGSDQSSGLQSIPSASVSKSSGSSTPTTDKEAACKAVATTSAPDTAGGATSVDFSTVGFDLNKLHSRLKKGTITYEDRSASLKRRNHSKKKKLFIAASMGVDGITKEGLEKEEGLAAATRELERTFDKSDFKHMKVLGQFNLGFILAKLNGDLFIIDQHASDEKYNFERLSKSTILNRQPLLRPLPLDLSAAEEVIVTTHIETFRKNGFDFVENKDGHPGQRLCLIAVPFSKNITFGRDDVQELVSLLADEPTFNVVASGKQIDDTKHDRNFSSNRSFVRPSRVRSMLASRACRSSIMIGDALSKKEMSQVLSHLAELDSPWNCPHGRPTMRHLIDLASIT